MIENNNNQNSTDQKIKEISEKIEIFIKKNKLKLIIWWVIFFLIILVLMFWWEKQYDKSKLRNKMTEISFEVEKKETVDLLEWTVKVIKPWVTWLVKEYYEIVNWEEKIRIREKTCEWCRSVEKEEQQIGKFPVNEALIESTKVVQNTLQFVKNWDFNSFINILAADWQANMEENDYRRLLKEEWFKLTSFTMWECIPNLKQTSYMEIICKTDVIYEYSNTWPINAKLDISSVYNKSTKTWWMRFPFAYRMKTWDYLTEEYVTSWRINATVNTSLSILEWTIEKYFNKLSNNNIIFWKFRTNQIYDYIIVEDFVVYKKQEKNKNWWNDEVEVVEKSWEYKINVRRWVVDDFSQFNKNFDFSKDDKWIYTIYTYFPVSKIKYIKWKGSQFENWEAFSHHLIKITPWINTVNPYLKFPTIQFKLEWKNYIYDEWYILWWQTKNQ